MRAAIYSGNGPSSIIELAERPDPVAGPGEAVVRVRRSGVNPTDWKFRESVPQRFDEVAPGHDGAGVVASVGEGVTEVRPGDRVWIALGQGGRPYGTSAELSVQPVANLAPLPAGLSDDDAFDLGAALGVPFITAHRALTSGDVERLHPGALSGRTVLVAGGAGAVGNAAIQLARWAGARVITTISSPEKAALARAAGAHETVNYRESDAQAEIGALAPEGVDLVVEVAPAANLAMDVALTKVHGTIAIYANDGGDDATVSAMAAFMKNIRIQFLVLYTLRRGLLAAAREDVSAALEDGAIRVGPDAGLPLHRFALEHLGDAHDAVENGAVGKVLVEL